MKKKLTTASDPSKIEILKQGKQTEFWRIIIDALEESKEDIQKKQDSEDLKELSPELYKIYNELFKAKKQLIDTLIKTPDNIISWLTKPVTERQNFDPYDKEE
jgi:hypothetical protein